MQCLGIWCWKPSLGKASSRVCQMMYLIWTVQSPVSDNFAAIPDFEQCAELIVKHCRRGEGESMQLQRSHRARASAETIDTELWSKHLKCKCTFNGNTTEKVVSVSWDLSRCIVCIYLWNQNLCAKIQVPELAHSASSVGQWCIATK